MNSERFLEELTTASTGTLYRTVQGSSSNLLERSCLLPMFCLRTGGRGTVSIVRTYSYVMKRRGWLELQPYWYPRKRVT